VKKCTLRAREDAATTIERAFLAKWHAKHQATFRYPKRRQGMFCFVCNWFVDNSDVLGACEAEDELDKSEKVLDTESTVLTIKSHSMGSIVSSALPLDRATEKAWINIDASIQTFKRQER
jgi:hypothetical protein